MKTFYFKLKFYFVTVLRILYSFINGGSRCVICSRKTYFMPLCKRCKKQYFNVSASLSHERCSVCGKELLSTKNTCMECREEKVITSVNKVIPLFSYRLWNKEILFMWKMQSIRVFSFLFSGFINEVLQKENIKYVIPVPPRPGKIRENGWDQINELCNFLECFYKIKVLNILVRKSSVQQKKLDRTNRLEKINTAYELENEEKIKKEFNKSKYSVDSKVALIDDVSTTGATLEFCSSLLKKAGIKDVTAITLFTVD